MTLNAKLIDDSPSTTNFFGTIQSIVALDNTVWAANYESSPGLGYIFGYSGFNNPPAVTITGGVSEYMIGRIVAGAAGYLVATYATPTRYSNKQVRILNSTTGATITNLSLNAGDQFSDYLVAKDEVVAFAAYDSNYDSIVYAYDPSDWSKKVIDINPDYTIGGIYDVAVNSTHIIIGCPEADNGSSRDGYVFKIYIATGAVALAIPTPPGPQNYPTFGARVACSETVLIVYDDTGGDAGTIYGYDIDTAELLYQFDVLVMGSGSDGVHTIICTPKYLFLSCPRQYGSLGAIYVYDINAGLLIHTEIDPEHTIDFQSTSGFGTSLSLTPDGTKLAVGTEGTDNTPSTKQGAVFVYDISD